LQLFIDDPLCRLCKTLSWFQRFVSSSHLSQDVGRKRVAAFQWQSPHSCVSVVQHLLECRPLGWMPLVKNSVIGFVPKGFS
jgi:hypothetical protein